MKPLITTLLLFVSITLSAPPPVLGTIFREEGINPFEAISRAVFIAETSGDTLAYNRKELATGPFQIRPVRLKDYVRRTGKKLTLKDCYDYKTSKIIFMYYASKFGPYETDRAIRAWNGKIKVDCRIFVPSIEIK